MAVNEKRINLIEKKMVLHDEQIGKLFSEVNEVKQVVTFSKGMLKGAIALLIYLSIGEIGLLDAFKM